MSDAPYLSDITQGVAGTATWLTTQDGVRIRAALWPQAEARGTVFVYTGRTEYAEKYALVAQSLKQRGYAVLAIDWRGQGLSDRVHPDPCAGHIDDFSAYQQDVSAVIAHARALELPQPWMMLAHSMGGCIGLRTLMGDHPFAAAGFSAPMWGIKLPSLLRGPLTLLGRVGVALGQAQRYAPGMSEQSELLKAPFDENPLSTDRATWQWMCDQLTTHPELIIGGATFGWADAALRETQALAQMPAPDLPASALLGTDESIVDPARIKTRMAAWPKGTLNLLPGFLHESLMESAATRDSHLDMLCAAFPV